jgi:hypothetical protein
MQSEEKVRQEVRGGDDDSGHLLYRSTGVPGQWSGHDCAPFSSSVDILVSRAIVDGF